MLERKKLLKIDVEGLNKRPLSNLKALWREVIGMEPPATRTRSVLVRAIGYELQATRHGGLARDTQRQLKEMAEHLRRNPHHLPEAPTRWKPGTTLIREWHGERHEVIVTDSGFIYAGVSFGSLSAVAKRITGTSWNGPAFFGLRKQTRQL